MTDQEYYNAPSDKVFNEIKEAVITIWKTYYDEFGYASQKIGSVQEVKNIKDNWWFMVGMFDVYNQKKLVDLLEGEAKDLVYRATEPERLAHEQLQSEGSPL